MHVVRMNTALNTKNPPNRLRGLKLINELYLKQSTMKQLSQASNSHFTLAVQRIKSSSNLPVADLFQPFHTLFISQKVAHPQE